eukprot:938696-Rhodomonas_salina.2
MASEGSSLDTRVLVPGGYPGTSAQTRPGPRDTLKTAGRTSKHRHIIVVVVLVGTRRLVFWAALHCRSSVQRLCSGAFRTADCGEWYQEFLVWTAGPRREKQKS